jgi:hypothetical protein
MIVKSFVQVVEVSRNSGLHMLCVLANNGMANWFFIAQLVLLWWALFHRRFDSTSNYITILPRIKWYQNNVKTNAFVSQNQSHLRNDLSSKMRS